MSATIRVEGLDETLKAFEKFGSAGDREVKKATRASLERVRGTAIKSIQQGPKSGIIYERSPGQNLSQTHQASAKGQAPATDTGTLVNSIKVTQTSSHSGEVGSGLQYAFWLEYGTINMDERPWLRPALKKNQQWIVDRYAKALETATRAYYGR